MGCVALFGRRYYRLILQLFAANVAAPWIVRPPWMMLPKPPMLARGSRLMQRNISKQ
jgi:hypothetical protein